MEKYMRKNKLLPYVLIAFIVASLLTGCGPVDTMNDIAYTIADAIGGGNSNVSDDDDDHDNGHTGNGNNGSGHNGSGTGNSHHSTGKEPAPIEEQFELVSKLRNKWFAGNRVPDGTELSYAVCDFDGNGRIEIVQMTLKQYGLVKDYVVLEVNEDCDALYEVEIRYDGEVFPDLSNISQTYITDNGDYYSASSYGYTQDDATTIEYIVKMEDGVITAQTFRYYKMSYDDFSVTYYDSKGNKLASSSAYYALELENFIGGYEWENRWFSEAQFGEISMYDNDASDGDLYTFIEHSYGLFMDGELADGDFDGELTIYTDSNSADYQSLENVYVLNEGATGNARIRFKASKDAYFGLNDGVWNNELEILETDSRDINIYYNRVYELIVNASDTNPTQEIHYGTCSMLITEEYFGSQNGTYTIKVGDVLGRRIDAESRFTQALGIVAYEVAQVGDCNKFSSDEESFCNTAAEIVSFIYGLENEATIPAHYYYKIEDSLLNWTWRIFYYDEPAVDSVVYHNEYDDGCIDENEYDEDYVNLYRGHYVVQAMEYEKKLQAVSNIEFYYNHNGEVSEVEYTIQMPDGEKVKVMFEIESDSDCAFGISAKSAKIVE